MSVLQFPERLPPDDGDAALMARLAEGDVAALESLVSNHWAALVAYASRLLDDRDAAQDVVQAAFIRLHGQRLGLKPGSIRAYLYRLTRNLVIDEQRRRGARARAIASAFRAAPRAPRTPVELLHDDEIGAAVDRAVQALPPRRREVFVLAHLRGFTYREIADLMQISVKTVENQMTAALTDLRRTLAGLLAQ